MRASSGQPLQNILWLVAERAGRGIVTATVLGLVARHLAPTGFGQLNFALALTALAAPLASLGLEGLVVAELIRRPQVSGAILGTALRLRLWAGLVAAALLILAVSVGAPAADTNVKLVAVTALVLLFQPAEIVDLWFQRHLDSRRTVVVRLVAVLTGSAIKFILVVRDAPLLAFAWAQVADVALIALGLTWSARRSPHPSGPWKFDPEIARELWRKGAPLALSALVVALSMRADQLLVRHWLGDTEAGIYFASSRLIEVALFAGSTVLLSLFPALAASHTRSPADYYSRLQALFDALSALGWIAALGCTLLGPLAIRLLYGPSYLAAGGVLIIQGWAALFALSAGARWHFILLSAPPLLNLAAAGIHIAVLLALGAWLTPLLGVKGTALAWLAAMIASGYLTTWLFPALRPSAAAQTRGLLIPFSPARWHSLLQTFRT